jgi:hypothetical protein
VGLDMALYSLILVLLIIFLPKRVLGELLDGLTYGWAKKKVLAI